MDPSFILLIPVLFIAAFLTRQMDKQQKTLEKINQSLQKLVDKEKLD